MNELIPINHVHIGGAMMPTVDARSLHEALGIKSKFADWFPRQVAKTEYAENVDYTVLNFENDGITSKFLPVDYRLSLPMALDLASAENTEEARSARRQLVNAALQGIVNQPPAPLSREQQLASAVVLAQQVLAEKDAIILAQGQAIVAKDAVIEVQAAKMAEDAPKVELVDEMIARGDLLDCGQASTWLLSRGYPCPGRNGLIKYLVKRGYACSVFEGYRTTQKGAETGYVGNITVPMREPRHDKTFSSKVGITAVKGLRWLQMMFPKKVPAPLPAPSNTDPAGYLPITRH